MKTGDGNAPRGSATSDNVAERLPHRGRSLNITNLPAEIRDELNYRLNDGEHENELVEWLNSKPEVAEVVNELFDGTPISEQNLSEWRKHGYRKWHAHRTIVDGTLALSDNTGDLAETGIDCDKLLLTLTAAYAEAIQSWIITPGEQLLYKLAVYKNLTNGVIALRRAELLKVRLEIERERLELLREKRGNKSDSSSSAPASSSAESANENPTISQPKPRDESQRRDAVPSPASPTTSPPSEPFAGQPPTPNAISASPKPVKTSTNPTPSEPPAAPPAPAPHPTKLAPAPSAPETPPHSRPSPAYRDPRSRYSLL